MYDSVTSQAENIGRIPETRQGCTGPPPSPRLEPSDNPSPGLVIQLTNAHCVNPAGLTPSAQNHRGQQGLERARGHVTHHQAQPTSIDHIPQPAQGL